MRQMQRIRARAAICAFALGAALACVAQAPAPTPAEPTLEQRLPEGPTLTITTREVLLDVVATDKNGHPVHGLKASDFHITEEGRPEQITSFNEHTAQIAATVPPPQLPPNTFTNFDSVPTTNAYTVILLDALDTRVDDQMMVRHELIKFLKKMQPGTPVAIFQLDLHMRLIQTFTTDPRVLLEAAESKRNMPILPKMMEGNRDLRVIVSGEKLQDGFRVMGRYLAGFPGRKNLVWIAGAVPGTGFPGGMLGGDFTIGNPFADEFSVLGQDPQKLTDELTLSRVSVYPIDARGLEAPPMFDASNSAMPKSGSMMQWEAEQASEHMFMNSVAESTGGKAYYNNNSLGKQLAQIIDDGSNYYTIAYATTNRKWDGKFLKINVTVDRPGVVLQHRPGYYAIDRTQQEQQQLAALRRKGLANETSYAPSVPQPGAGSHPEDGAAPAKGGAAIQAQHGGLDAAMQLGAVPATEIVFAAHLSPEEKVIQIGRNKPMPHDNFLRADFRDKPFRNYFVSIRADARDVHFTRSQDGKRHASLEFVTVVYTPTGQVVNSLQSTTSFDGDEQEYRAMLKKGLPGLQEIAVPVKGSYFLRIGVHDLASDRIGVLQIAADQVHPEPASAQTPAH